MRTKSLDDEGQWHRVSVIATFYFLLRSLRQLIRAWPALVPLIAGGERVRELLWYFGLPALLVLLLVSVFLYFWYFRYRIERGRIHIQSGVISRHNLNLDFERVQQADILQPFYFRLFGLATLSLESAGSAQQEVSIPGISCEEAGRIQSAIQAYRKTGQMAQKTGSAHSDTCPDGEALPDYELRLSWTDVCRYGLMHWGLLVALAALFPVLQSSDVLLELAISRLEETVLVQWAAILREQQMTQTAILVAGFLILLLAVLVLALFSMLAALLRFGHYHLTQRGDQYRYRAGIGTVRTRSLRMHKLQQIVVTQGAVARLLRRYSVSISKVQAGAEGAAAGSSRFLIPVLTAISLEQLSGRLELPRPRWSGVDIRYIAWHTITAGTAVVLALALFLQAMGQPGWWSLPGYAVVFLCVWRYWSCLGIFQDQSWLAVKSGFIGSTTAWVPVHKMQKIMLSQPPWLKAWGLANLHVWTAAGRLTLPFLAYSGAAALRDRTLAQVAISRRRWY